MPNPSTDADKARLQRLLSFLAGDPSNAALLIDAGETALRAGEATTALALMQRAADATELTPSQLNTTGHAALSAGEFDTATAIFEKLLATAPDDSALRFNLAWSFAMAKNFEKALPLLDAGTVEALPQAATLQVQTLHAMGQFDEAAAAGRASLQHFPEDRALAAAVSVLALDIEDLSLAEQTAAVGGDHPDALTTRGSLALKADNPAAARALFEQALERNPEQPRALVGVGLTELLTGANEKGAEAIEQGARLFGDHIGSWIAAGWARIFAGDMKTARQHFETALAIDHSFGETHGSLGVLAILEGQADTARREAQTALRLDPKSFSGALAKAMIAASDGDSVRARTILDRALSTPIDASGRTLAQTLAAYGTRI